MPLEAAHFSPISAHQANRFASAGPAVCGPLREIALDTRRSAWVRRVAIDALTELNDLAAYIMSLKDRETE